MSTMGDQLKDSIIFKKQDALGINDAEDDKKFLLECFVDTGDLETLRKFDDARCLVLGRTGVGKTALLTKLKDNNIKKNNVIVINPEALAMHHISNSTIIRYMNDLGIDMNTFFKLLWRHALCVEIFNHHFRFTSSDETESLIEKLRYKFKKTNTHHLRALNYLEQWKHTFWKKSDDHVTEMISKTESELGGTLGVAGMGVKAGVNTSEKMTEEQKSVVKERAQSIVDEVQMREVTDLLSMLNEVVDDQQKQYYIVIDKLDKGWVEDNLRYKLIKALIETVRDINRFENLKPIVVLRADLLGHVFEVTHDTGFQEEKYSSLYMHVRWTREQLVELIDKRISYLLKSRYKRKDLNHTDILPNVIDGKPSIDYILDRTLMRPRDVIDFFNTILREAAGKTEISEQIIKDAARIYSRDRLDSIYYEWHADYPLLKKWIKLVREKGTDFFVGSFSDKDIKAKCLEYAVNYTGNTNLETDLLYEMAKNVIEEKMDIEEFKHYLMHVFYTTGIVGLRLDGYDKPSWSYDLQKEIAVEDIDKKTMVYVHPCFRSALNITSSF